MLVGLYLVDSLTLFMKAKKPHITGNTTILPTTNEVKISLINYKVQPIVSHLVTNSLVATFPVLSTCGVHCGTIVPGLLCGG